MNAGEIRLGPGVPGLDALGMRGFEDFFGPVGADVAEANGPLARATLVESGPGYELVRYPLPGTPDESGRFRGAPRGAGTGWLTLRRYTGASLADRWRARFTHPRSTSLAEREWNLVCHLRAAGVGTPEPLAVGRGSGGVFASRSFVVTRELEEMVRLDRWLDATHEPRAEGYVARALGIALGRMFDAGVAFGGHVKGSALDPRSLWIGAPRVAAHDDETCVARTIDSLRAAARGEPAPKRLRWGKLPEIAFTSFAGGRIVDAVSPRQRRSALYEFMDRSPPALGPRSALRLWLGATPSAGRDEWRFVLRALEGELCSAAAAERFAPPVDARAGE